jgi:hypothetical protein
MTTAVMDKLSPVYGYRTRLYLSMAMAVMDSVETNTETELTRANVRHSQVLSPRGQKLQDSSLKFSSRLEYSRSFDDN